VPSSGSATLYQRLRLRFDAELERNRDPRRPLAQTRIDGLRGELVSTDRDDALLRAAALLSALSKYVRRELSPWDSFSLPPVRSSPEFGGEEFFVTPAGTSAIASRLPEGDMPRLDQQVSWMYSCCHAGVRITPTRSGNHRLVRCPLPHATAAFLRARVDNGPLRIAVSPLSLDAHLQGRPRPGFPANEPDRFLLHSVGTEEPQAKLLTNILERCSREAVSILVLPELRVPSGLEQVIVEFLRHQACDATRGVLLVVAGSWHVHDDKTGEWVNRSLVLDCRGDTIWRHHKLAEFNITAANVHETPELKTLLGIGDRGGIEGIHTGGQLEFCDTALGRLAVAICCGFFHHPLRQLLRDSGADIFLVPAMSPSLAELDSCARELVSAQHAATFVAGCGAMARKDKHGHIQETAASFWRLPLKDSTGHAKKTMPCPRSTGDYLHILDLSDI
jgi:predicted amidohydrolase